MTDESPEPLSDSPEALEILREFCARIGNEVAPFLFDLAFAGRVPVAFARAPFLTNQIKLIREGLVKVVETGGYPEYEAAIGALLVIYHEWPVLNFPNMAHDNAHDLLMAGLNLIRRFAPQAGVPTSQIDPKRWEASRLGLVVLGLAAPGVKIYPDSDSRTSDSYRGEELAVSELVERLQSVGHVEEYRNALDFVAQCIDAKKKRREVLFLPGSDREAPRLEIAAVEWQLARIALDLGEFVARQPSPAAKGEEAKTGEDSIAGRRPMPEAFTEGRGKHHAVCQWLFPQQQRRFATRRELIGDFNRENPDEQVTEGSIDGTAKRAAHLWNLVQQQDEWRTALIPFADFIDPKASEQAFWSEQDET